jgi:hypothetical protein
MKERDQREKKGKGEGGGKKRGEGKGGWKRWGWGPKESRNGKGEGFRGLRGGS